MERNIIHIDISSFAVAIERMKDSKLRTRPVIVAFPNMIRSLVYAASPEAKEAGIHRGMPLQLAQKLCKTIIVVPPDYKIYRRAMEKMFTVLSNFTPIVEPVGYGHAYLDMTGTTRLFGATKDAASKVQREIQAQLRLESTLGVAQNKLVSKIASTVIKPLGVQDVALGTEEKFIAPLGVNTLPIVNYKTKQQLLDLNIQTIGQIAQIPLSQLTLAFGSIGRKLYRASHGIDYSPVRTPQHIPNISEEITLSEDTNDFYLLRAELFRLIEKSAFRMRQENRMAKKMFLEILYSDHKIEIGQKKLAAPSFQENELFGVAEFLLNKKLARRIRVRKLVVRFYDLVSAVKQMSLFETSQNLKSNELARAIYQIRNRFGTDAIKYAMKIAA